MPADTPAGDSAVWAILLAAGRSRRFADDNKLLIRIRGTSLVRRVAEQLLASRVTGVIAVTGFEHERIEQALEGLDVRLVHNPEFDEGIASSIRYGIAALPAAARGALVCLADMPGTTPELIDALIAAFEEADGEKIVYPVRGDGAQANPVLWPRRFFAELGQLTGDTGAKELIKAHANTAFAMETGRDASFEDIDTAEDLAAWQAEKDGSGA